MMNEASVVTFYACCNLILNKLNKFTSKLSNILYLLIDYMLIISISISDT